MSDDLWLSLPRVAATPKKDKPEPRPQEPMRAQIKGPRRNPSTDQKKQRRQLKRRPTRTAVWGEVKDYWDMTGDIPVWTQPHDELVIDALHSWKGDPGSIRTHLQHAFDHDPQPNSGSGKIMRAWAEGLLTELRNAPHVPVKLYRGEVSDGEPHVGQRFEWNLRGASSKRFIAKRFTKSDYLYSTWTPVLRIITDTTGIRIADYNTGSGMNVEEDEYLLMGTYEVTAVDDTKTPIVTEVRQVSKTTSRWSKKSVLEVTWTEPGEVGNRTHITMEENGTVPLDVIAGLRGVMDEVPGEHRNKQGLAWEEFKADIARNGILNPIFVTIDYGQAPRISEGNHRRDAAVELGLPEVPVQIRYFGHAEQQGRLVERASKVAKTAGWVRCSDGKTRWGPYGAAGVLFRNKQSDGYHYLFAKRGAGTDSGGTWAYPGGALDSPGEDPTVAALREAREELGAAVPKTFRVVEVIEDRPVPEWAYWTTIAEVDEKFEGGDYDWETDEEGWFSADEVEALNLHPAVRQIWPRLRSVAAKQEVVTDEDGREWTLIWKPTTLYHATGLTASEEILIAGFRIPKMPINGADYGPGIYFTPDREWVTSYGPRVIEAEIVPGAKILDITHLWPAGVIDHSYEQLSRARVRELADEYGCVGVFDGDMVCVFDPSKVRAVRIARKVGSRTIRLYHGTTSMALDKMRSSGQIITLDPAAVAAQIEKEYGLPADSVLGETSFYFSRDRQTDPYVYFTSSTDTASSYAKGGSEIVFDALISAWFVMHPDPNNERETTDPVAMQREPWVREQMAKHHGEPTLLTLDIPVEFVWEHFDDHSRQHFGTIDKFIEVLDEYGLDSAQLKAPIPASYITQTQRVS